MERQLRYRGNEQVDNAVCNFFESLAVKAKIMPPRGSTRVMRYPYTVTAKFALFPWRAYYKNVWLFKYSCFAAVLLFPLFVKIRKIANSPENVQKWKEIRAKEAAGHH